MKRLSHIYRILNVLSVDVAFGAACGAIFFFHLLGAKVNLASIFLLSGAVWVIYTTDHLFDAFRLQGPAITERHSFHQRHFWQLIAAIVIVIAVMTPLLFLIEREVLLAGMIMTISVIIYLMISNKIGGLKELLIAALYCIGISIPANTYAQYSAADILILLQFFLVCLTNLCVFSIFETKEDKAHRFPSIALFFGRRIALVISSGLLLLNAVIAVMSDRPNFSMILLFMGACHVLMLAYEKRLREGSRYRLLGDALFFTPIVTLWLPQP